MKKYYNETTQEWYNEGQSMTRYLSNGSLFTGIPSVEQLTEWGFVEYVPPTPPEPSKEDLIKQRMAEIQDELASMDYLTSKYIDVEDMSEYGDWQAKRRALREEYRQLEEELGE
jgi:hypothetical protein